jgi:hypothetical protein
MPEGDAWLESALKGYAGGKRNPRWRKEYEIEYGALGGSALFPEWELWSTNGRIIIPPFAPIGYRLYGSYDHGWRNPGCYLVHGIDSDGRFATLWECYADHVPISAWAKIIQGESVRLIDGREFAGNPYAGHEVWKVADPSMWAEDNAQSDAPNKSAAKLFRDAGVSFIAGERGGDTTLAEWLHGHHWKDPMDPLWRITATCEKLIWEIGRQRHKEISEKVALNKEQPEQLVDKDNHAWDSAKYFLMRFPPKALVQKPEDKGNTFAWWRKQTQAAQAGRPVGSFRREMVS